MPPADDRPIRIPPPTVLKHPSLAKRTTYCNQPDKLAFPTARAARGAVRRFAEKYPETRLEPYRCTCGRFHLATIPEDA